MYCPPVGEGIEKPIPEPVDVVRECYIWLPENLADDEIAIADTIKDSESKGFQVRSIVKVYQWTSTPSEKVVQ